MVGNIGSTAGNKLVPNEGIPDSVNTIPIRAGNRNKPVHAASCIFPEHKGSRSNCIDHRSLQWVRCESVASWELEFTHVVLLFSISFVVLVSSQVAPFTAFALAFTSC